MQPKLFYGGATKRVLNDGTNDNDVNGKTLTAPPYKRSKTMFSERRNQMRELHIATLKQIEKDREDDHLTCSAGRNRQWMPYLALHGFTQLDKDEQDGWQLCTILFDDKDDDQKTPRWTRFREWLLERVSTGAQLAAKRVSLRDINDPYAVVYEYLTYGSIAHAARAAIDSAKDEVMSHLIAMSPPSSRELRRAYCDLLNHTIASDAFDTFSPYAKRCWYLLCGRPEKCLAMDGSNMDWRQAFVLYMLYYWVDEDQDPFDAVMNHYVREVEPSFFSAGGSKDDVRPTWFVVFRWWWIQHYHLELAHLDPHPLHLLDWSPRLAYCFTSFFPKALPPAQNKEIAHRFLYELKRLGVAGDLIPDIVKQ
ncbi:hypothetical protein BX666DRAFT_2032787 [Dichotomocladium elegans]|nr:hypothetical protein BX666DRAFT_2032787 [Dichotomocladium elegans]